MTGIPYRIIETEWSKCSEGLRGIGARYLNEDNHERSPTAKWTAEGSNYAKANGHTYLFDLLDDPANAIYVAKKNQPLRESMQ